MPIKQVFLNKGTNEAAIAAEGHIVIQNQLTAEKSDYLPHNAFTIANLSGTNTHYIFLDDFANQDNPDYVLFPNQQINVNLDDGVSFTTIFFKNTSTTTETAINEIKFRIATIREV